MKKKLVFLAAICFSVIIAFAGCGIVLEGGPAVDDTVYGNGSFAVRKGEWLYFTNGFKSLETVDVNANKFGNEKLAGVYRVKFNADGLVDTDDEGMPIGAELLAPHIAGYENGGIYIFGEYLYYTTPKTLNDKEGIPQKGLYSFERVKLDGTGHKTLYFVDNVSSNFSVSFQQTSSFVYIIIKNDTEVHSIEVGLSNDKVYSRLVAEGVISTAFCGSLKNLGGLEEYIYYTTAATIEKDGYTGYQVLRSKFDGSIKGEVVRKASENITLTHIKNNRIYYELNNLLYSTVDFRTIRQYASSTVDKFSPYFILNDQGGTDRGVVANYSGTMVRFIGKDASEPYQIIERNVSEILSVVGEFVYYKETGSEQILRIRFDGSGTKEVVAETMNLQIDSKNYFDCDGEYIFYFDNVEDSNKAFRYLHMLKIGAPEDADGKVSAQFIGVLDPSDVIVEEEEEE